ncbi:MAG: M55 family metallopeptidase [Anaerolineae bacterium]|jgi:D-amino peptidase|nr:M55 family metallopeptidase [Anaerolineae bacterium]
MRILIAADMEGITGVVHFDQVTPGHAEYARFRKLMTDDVNAAVRGAFAAGADEVIVSDGHWNATNILIESLDPRARLNSGSPRPYSMIEGIDSGIDGVLFIGYHARAGTPHAILDHTWSSSRVEGVWLTPAGGEKLAIGEIGLNGAVCGHFGAPVVMISGDQSACAEAEALFPGIVTAVVKQAKGRNAAECLPPAETAEMIEQCAAKGVDHLVAERPPKPLRLQGPITVAVEYVKSEMADDAAILPGARRAEGKVVEFVAQDMPEAYRAFRSLVGLA